MAEKVTKKLQIPALYLYFHFPLGMVDLFIPWYPDYNVSFCLQGQGWPLSSQPVSP